MIQKFFNGFLRFSGLAFTAILISCTPKISRVGIDPAPEFKAKPAVEDSFQTVVTSTASRPKQDKSQMVITKGALEKEFLFSTNMLSQLPTPLFSSLQSRVVYFTLKNGRVYMLEALSGRAVGKDNPKSFLPLAEFEILEETVTTLTLDFNLGMRNIIVVSDMATSDDPGSTEWVAASINFSYLESVTFENNRIFIRQVAQAQMGNNLLPLEVRYYLSPYNPDPQFVPTRSPGYDFVGYFEANPVLDTHGNTINYAMKFNIQKPIVFAISANTPAEYKETVKNGILYWNKILGENKIQVVELTNGQLSAPHPDYNIVQWTNWDAAGYAYADAHVDPRSGEVTHAQVFFPSAFTEVAIEKRVRVLEGSEKIFARNNSQKFSLNGFKTAQLCNRNIFKEFENSIQNTAPSGTITPAAMKKAVKDYVFEVIAHEIGHVLGLRHNFAGSLAANYDASDRRQLALSYYQNMKAPTKITSSSSVMEYSRFEESSWNGDSMQNGAPALSHDTVAINYLYLGKEIPKNSPTFCTDTHINKYADCNMSDASRSIISYAVGNYQYAIETLPVRVLNQYISSSKISDDPGLPVVPVQNVLLNINANVKSIATDRFKFLSLLKEEMRLIQIRSSLLPIWPAQDDSVFLLEKNYVADEVQRLGGLSFIINLAEKDLADFWINKFNALLEDPRFYQGTIGNKFYAFSKEEKEIMQRQFNLFSVHVKNEIIKANLKALSGENYSFAETYGQEKLETSKGWFDHPLTAELALVVQNISNHYIFSKENTKNNLPVVLKDGAGIMVELPLYMYPHDIRLTAADVWKAEPVALDYGYMEKPLNAAQMKTELEQLAEIDKIDFTKTSKIVLRWLLENKEIEKRLN